jgi:hypothetical protein
MAKRGLKKGSHCVRKHRNGRCAKFSTSGAKARKGGAPKKRKGGGGGGWAAVARAAKKQQAETLRRRVEEHVPLYGAGKRRR